MILNAWTVSALFLAGVGVLLALAGGWIAVRALARLRSQGLAGAGVGGAGSGAAADDVLDRLHLLALVLAVLAGLRFLAWPHFYLLLQSYVPDLAAYGVMCAFGVTRIEPGLVLALQVLKPLVFLLAGFWWLAGRVEALGPRTRLALALPLVALALADSVVEVVYLLAHKGGRAVTCCTRFLETESGAVAGLRSPLRGLWGGSSAWTLGLYLAAAVATLVALLFLRRRGRAPGGGVLAALAALGAAKLALTYWAWMDVLAPRVLGLPYHHCVYELLTGSPALGLAALAAVSTSGALLWLLGLQVWRRRAPRVTEGLQRRVLGFAALALATELVVVVVQLL